MKYTDDDLIKLIETGSETRNLDYKLTITWDKHHTDERLEIAKDILAFSNTRDGGWIIIGVDDNTNEYVGLTEEAFNSLDVTKVAQFVNKYADPKINCEVICKTNLQGKRAVFIHISEFSEDPVVCKSYAVNSKSQTVLVKGGLYTRTNDATSELVCSSEDMRRILEMGLNKKSDEILAKINRLIIASNKRKGGGSLNTTLQMAQNANDSQDVIPSYVEEITEATTFLDKKVDQKKGYIEVVAYPLNYDEKRFVDHANSFKVFKESIVHLRGWDFPHDDMHGNSTNFIKGHQSSTSFEDHREAWRVHKSGLFVWRSNFWEDSKRYVEEGKVFSFVGLIYTITEILIFTKRFYSGQSDNIFLSITLTDCEGRKLEAFQPGVLISGYYISRENIIPIKKDLESIELESSPTTIAREIIKEIFAIFNWNDPADSMIEDWQKKLIERGG